MMKNSDRAFLLKQYLDRLFPRARCELVYQRDYELVIAVVLSAQTTDRAVNKATPLLFAHFDTLEKLKRAPIEVIESDIHALGLSHHRAKSIKDIATMLMDKYGGVVPSEAQRLLELPGVGNKTMNVIQAELFHVPAIAVDTHVERISKRLRFAKKGDVPDVVEKKLKALFSPRDYIKINHQIIDFGRAICTARNPRCQACEMRLICAEYRRIARI